MSQDNPKSFVESLPVGESGDFKIVRNEVTKDDVMWANMRAIRNGFSWMIADPGTFTRLHEKKNGIWMSNTRMEIQTNREFARRARGDVLVFGLGLGVMFDLVDWDVINSMTIVELNEGVIELVENHIENFEWAYKVKIVWEDALKYRCSEKFDTVYFDIWPDVCLDNWDQIMELKERGEKWLTNDGWVGCWLEDELWEKVYCRHCEVRRDGEECGWCEICWYCEQLEDECWCERCEWCEEKEDECGCNFCSECEEKEDECICEELDNNAT